MHGGYTCERCNHGPCGLQNVKRLGTLQLQQTWRELLGLLISRPLHVCGRWKAALRQLRGRIRLFYTLHMLIFEYPHFVRLALLKPSHSFHALPPDFKANGNFSVICFLRKIFTLCHHCLYRGVTNRVTHSTPFALPCPAESAASIPAGAAELPSVLLFLLALKCATAARKAAKCHMEGEFRERHVCHLEEARPPEGRRGEWEEGATTNQHRLKHPITQQRFSPFGKPQ